MKKFPIPKETKKLNKLIKFQIFLGIDFIKEKFTSERSNLKLNILIIVFLFVKIIFEKKTL